LFLFFIRGEAVDEGSEEDSEESESEEESSEEEATTSTTTTTTTTTTTAQPELSRAEKRDLKKKQAEDKKQTEDDDPDLINPNHVQQKMNISDLNTPRELTRLERYARIFHRIYLIFKHSHLFFLENRRRNKTQRNGIGRLALPADFPSWLLIIYFDLATCSRKDGRG
jgi:hypothetical protein